MPNQKAKAALEPKKGLAPGAPGAPPRPARAAGAPQKAAGAAPAKAAALAAPLDFTGAPPSAAPFLAPSPFAAAPFQARQASPFATASVTGGPALVRPAPPPALGQGAPPPAPVQGAPTQALVHPGAPSLPPCPAAKPLAALSEADNMKLCQAAAAHTVKYTLCQRIVHCIEKGVDALNREKEGLSPADVHVLASFVCEAGCDPRECFV